MLTNVTSTNQGSPFGVSLKASIPSGWPGLQKWPSLQRHKVLQVLQAQGVKASRELSLLCEASTFRIRGSKHLFMHNARKRCSEPEMPGCPLSLLRNPQGHLCHSHRAVRPQLLPRFDKHCRRQSRTTCYAPCGGNRKRQMSPWDS